MATGTPRRRAWRAASPRPRDSHQACPSRQPRSGEVDPALGAEGDPEPGRPELEHPGVVAGLVALLALAQVALAVDAAEAAVVAVQLGDVEQRPGALGDAEHRGHARPRGRLQQRPHRLGVDGQRPLGVPARVDRPGERELGEHRDLAALDPGLLEHGRMRRQVAVEVALRGVQGGEQDPHDIPPDQR